jgi:site-specific recombinase XerD
MNTALTIFSPARPLIQEERERFLEFFAVNIRNPNTRLAYTRAVRDFFRWTEARGLTLPAIRPFHIATYMERLTGAAPSVNQKLAAIRMLFDWLVTGGVVPTNPTATVRGPRHVVKVGKTSVLTAQDVRTLLDAISFGNAVKTRDRALICAMYDQRRLKIWKKFWDE